MSKNKLLKVLKAKWPIVAFAVGGAALLVLVWFVAPSLYEKERVQSALEECGAEQYGDLQNECVFRIIDSEIRTKSVAAGFDVFSSAYELFPNFANGGCHQRSHRMGDVVYYSLYFGKESLDAIDFPQSTTACGYGFYHGFMEHLIQDAPTAETITKTCDYFVNRLESTMGDIESICYHGAGHGLALAQTERLTQADWGNVDALVEESAKICSSLTTLHYDNIAQCYEGIFNILVNHMVLNEYGFSYDMETPFAVCERVEPILQKECIYEVAMKIDSIAKYDPRNLVNIVSSISDEPTRIMAFGVGVAGIIQQVVATDGGYERILNLCNETKEPYYTPCVGSIVWGLYEHGDPQKEYKKVLAFCADELLQKESKSMCYERAAGRLSRFYSPDRIGEICREFPEAYRNSCNIHVARNG